MKIIQKNISFLGSAVNESWTQIQNCIFVRSWLKFQDNENVETSYEKILLCDWLLDKIITQEAPNYKQGKLSIYLNGRFSHNYSKSAQSEPFFPLD